MKRIEEGKISYPKSKTKVVETPVGRAEPLRKSMYDHVMENLKKANRVTFLHRLIYVGEHNYKQDFMDFLVEIFETIIDKVNKTTNLEKLTGFLLYYPKYFVHVVEGDEDSINKHLELLFNADDFEENFGKLKLLIHLNHINKRWISEWTYYNGIPSTLLGTLNTNCSIQEWGKYVTKCVEKINHLIYEFVTKSSVGNRYSSEQEVEQLKKEIRFSVSDHGSIYQHTSRTNERWKSSFIFKDPYVAHLPEYGLLDFFLMSNFTMDLQRYYKMYGKVGQIIFDEDVVWPTLPVAVPLDVFEKPYSFLLALPKEEKDNSSEEDYEIMAEDDAAIVTGRRETRISIKNRENKSSQ